VKTVADPDFDIEIYSGIIKISFYTTEPATIISVGVISEYVKILNGEFVPKKLIRGLNEFLVFYSVSVAVFDTLVLTLQTTRGITVKTFNLKFENSNLTEIPEFFSKTIVNEPLYLIGSAVKLGNYFYCANQLYKSIDSGTEIYFFKNQSKPAIVRPLEMVEIGRYIELLEMFEKEDEMYKSIRNKLVRAIEKHGLENIKEIILEEIK
jgi:hypothetical protein